MQKQVRCLHITIFNVNDKHDAKDYLNRIISLMITMKSQSLTLNIYISVAIRCVWCIEHGVKFGMHSSTSNLNLLVDARIASPPSIKSHIIAQHKVRAIYSRCYTCMRLSITLIHLRNNHIDYHMHRCRYGQQDQHNTPP